jgi:hypothetical protein
MAMAEDPLGVRPGLLQRMFIGLDRRPTEMAVIQEGGAPKSTKAAAATSSNTYINYKTFDNMTRAFFTRAFLLVFMFILTMFLTYLLLTPNDWFVNMFVGKDSVDDGSVAKALQEKKGRIFLLVFVLLVVFLVMHLVVLLVAYAICYLVATEKSPTQMEVPNVAKEIFTNMFWTIKWKGGMSDMTGYVGAFMLATVLFFVVFVSYFFFAKSYFQRLTYSTVLSDKERDEGKVDAPPMKRFMLHYCYLMIVVLVFGLGIANMNYGTKEYGSKILDVALILAMLLGFLLLSSKMMVEALRKRIGFFTLYLVIAMILSLGYAYVFGLFEM